MSLYDEKVYGVWSKESEEFSLNASGISDGDKDVDSATLLQVVYRVLKGSGVFVDPHRSEITSSSSVKTPRNLKHRAHPGMEEEIPCHGNGGEGRVILGCITSGRYAGSPNVPSLTASAMLCSYNS